MSHTKAPELRRYQLDFKPIGGYWQANCPFHPQPGAKLTVFGDLGQWGWYCLACGDGGGLRYFLSVQRTCRRRVPDAAEAKGVAKNAIAQIEYWHSDLLKHPETLANLLDHRRFDVGTVLRFKLGYVSGGTQGWCVPCWDDKGAMYNYLRPSMSEDLNGPSQINWLVHNNALQRGIALITDHWLGLQLYTRGLNVMVIGELEWPQRYIDTLRLYPSVVIDFGSEFVDGARMVADKLKALNVKAELGSPDSLLSADRVRDFALRQRSASTLHQSILKIMAQNMPMRPRELHHLLGSMGYEISAGALQAQLIRLVSRGLAERINGYYRAKPDVLSVPTLHLAGCSRDGQYPSSSRFSPFFGRHPIAKASRHPVASSTTFAIGFAFPIAANLSSDTVGKRGFDRGCTN